MVAGKRRREKKRGVAARGYTLNPTPIHRTGAGIFEAAPIHRIGAGVFRVVFCVIRCGWFKIGLHRSVGPVWKAFFSPHRSVGPVLASIRKSDSTRLVLLN